MITGIKKTHKTTGIYFDEASEVTTVITCTTNDHEKVSQRKPFCIIERDKAGGRKRW